MSTAWKPRRRWLQFGLRTFLLGITTIAVGFGLLVSRAHRQRQIIAAIEDRGGWASGSMAFSPWRPKWLCFGGGHLDVTTCLVSDYHRWYDPATGKWLKQGSHRLPWSRRRPFAFRRQRADKRDRYNRS
jgi:hypothetical protein